MPKYIVEFKYMDDINKIVCDSYFIDDNTITYTNPHYIEKNTLKSLSSVGAMTFLLTKHEMVIYEYDDKVFTNLLHRGLLSE